MSKQNFYWLYIIIGIAYVAIKIIFVMAGYLHLGALWHSLVPAVLTSAVGVFGLTRTIAPARKPILYWILIILPVLVLITTPPFMYWKQRELWLAEGRLPVLIIYEIMAVGQIAIALHLRRKND